MREEAMPLLSKPLHPNSFYVKNYHIGWNKIVNFADKTIKPMMGFS